MCEIEKDKQLIGSQKSDIQKRIRFAAEIFQKYSQELRAVISLKINDESILEDIYQNFFISIVHKPIPQDIEDMRSYLYRAITNDVIDASRRLKSYRNRIQRYAKCRKYSIIEENPEETVIQEDEVQNMLQMIKSRLPKREAEVLNKRIIQELSTSETANKLKINKRSVSRYLSSSLKKARKFVPKEEVDL